MNTAYLELCKPVIAALAALSAAAGFLLASARPDLSLAGVTAGVFLVACGSCSLNHYMERDVDSLMDRTRGRPLPSRRIRPRHALFFSLALLFSGTGVLASLNHPAAAVLGALAVAWYNGLYTYLKRKTAFAVLPGALTGAIPPAIGWVAGGGLFPGPALVLVCSLLFVWQVPHTLMFMLHYGGEYERAGLPSLTALFSVSQLLRITFVWTCAAAAGCFFIVSSGMIRSGAVNLSLLAASAWLIADGIRLLRGGIPAYPPAFRRINVYMVSVLSLVSIDKVLVLAGSVI